MNFKDHFSGHAKNYAKFRPTYPPELFDAIYQYVNHFDLAWDCGTGNGQVAVELAKKFEKVIASDASAQQIESASPNEKVEYHVAKAEDIHLADNSLDLLTVGQALHWFHFDEFFKEVERVMKPNGVFATWTYRYLTINEDLDKVLWKFFDAIESYWPPERDHVMVKYASISFPEHFHAIDFPDIHIYHDMTADEVLNYLRTWSSVKNYKKAHDREDPLKLIEKEFHVVWGDIQKKKQIEHPMVTKVFRIY